MQKSKVINIEDQSDDNSDAFRVKQDVENSSDEDEDSEVRVYFLLLFIIG